MLYAEVAVNSTFPHRQTFSYSVPDGMDVRAGHAVYVPFGRLTLQGVIVEIHTTPVFSEPEKIRAIRSIIGDRPLLDADRVALARWIEEYYLAPIFDAVALMLPPGFERKPVTTLYALVDAGEVEGLDLTPRQRDVLAAIAAGGRIELDALRTRIEFAGADAALTLLERRGLIARQYDLARPRIAAKTIEVAALAVPPDDALRRIAASEPPKHSRRAAVLDRLLAKRTVSVEEAIKLAGSRANLERLVRAASIRYDREGHHVQLAISTAEAADESRALTQTKRAAQATAIVRHLAAEDERTLAELREALRIDTSTVHWLRDIGAVTVRERPVERDPLAHFAVVAAPARGAAARAGGRGRRDLRRARRTPARDVPAPRRHRQRQDGGLPARARPLRRRRDGAPSSSCRRSR